MRTCILLATASCCRGPGHVGDVHFATERVASLVTSSGTSDSSSLHAESGAVG